MMCVPSDHLIQQPGVLADALERAARAAVRHDALVTLGIQPTARRRGSDTWSWARRWRRACAASRCFREKPDLATATAYLRGGQHLWNAGMLCSPPRGSWGRLSGTCRAPAQPSAPCLRAPEDRAAQWLELDATPIDYGIMERSQQILTVPCDPGWPDIGSWDVAAEAMPAGEDGHRQLAAALVSIDARDCVAYAPGKVVALVGVEGIVVVDAPDALLVSRREDAQRVREVVAALESRDLKDLT